MSLTEPFAACPSAAERTAAARALAVGQIDTLARLTDVGMAGAEALGLRLARGGDDADAAALAFTRVARAVRLTVALQARLASDLADLDADDDAARTAVADDRRDRIYTHVERAIEAEHEDEDEIERLTDDAWERLTDTPDADLTQTPVAEAAARICRDLGIALLLPQRGEGGAAGDG